MRKRIAFWLVCCAAPLCAQQASLQVVVTDPSGAALPGARVELLTGPGGSVAESETNEEGVAEIAADGAGLFVVEASADSFETVRRRAPLTAGENKIEIELPLATLATTVEISAAPEGIIAERTMSRDQVEAQPSPDLIESLKQTPGLNVLRRGGTNFEPVLYGLRETQVAMVVDSTRTFAAGPGRMDSELSHVEPGHIEDVRVAAGPYALTEGAGAFSAIIVRTPQVPRYDGFRLGGRTALGYGLNGAGRFARQRVYGGDRRFGFSVRAAGNKGNDYQAGDRGVGNISVPGDYSNHQFGGKLRFNPADNQEIALGGLYDEQTGVDFPGRQLRAEHFLMRGWNGSYLIKDPADRVSSVKFNVYLSKKSHRMSNDGKPTAMDMPGRTPPFALRVDLPTEADTFGGAGSIDFEPSSASRLKAGFDFYSLNQDAQRFIARRSNGFLMSSVAAWPDVSINDQGFYVQGTRSFERGELAAALRFDTVQADARRPSQFLLENTTSAIDRNEFNTSFSLSGRYRVLDGVSLGGGFGRVVRTANGLERYSDRFPSTKFQVSAEFMGDPSIRPEASLQGDANLEVRQGDLTLSVGTFYRGIEDYITVAPTDLPKRMPMGHPTVFRYLNGDHATFRGYQIGARYWFSRMVEWRVQGAKTIGDDYEANHPLIGRNEPVLGIAPLEMTNALRLTDPMGRLWAEYSVRTVWDQQRVARSRLETPSPGFTLHTVRLGADLPRQFALQFGIENLGDKYYFEHLNALNPFTRARIAEPGRNVYVGLTKSW